MLHEKCTKFFNNPGKIILFNPNEIKEMGYSPGAHTINPIGNFKLYKTDDIIVFHTDKGFGVEYKLKRYEVMNNRQSENNKRHKWSIHYGFKKEKIINDYIECQKKSFNINDKI